MATEVEPAEGSRDYMKRYGEGRHPGVAQILQYFAWAHLPSGLQPYSRNCAELAINMVVYLADGPELTTGLRKLLEAKDCFVRAALDAD